MSLHDDENVDEKKASSPSRDVHDVALKDINKDPKNPKHTSPIPYTPPLPFPQRVAKVKLDSQFQKFLES